MAYILLLCKDSYLESRPINCGERAHTS